MLAQNNTVHLSITLMLWVSCVLVCIVYYRSWFSRSLKGAVISVMRTVIRVIDTAAVITGTVIQDNHKKQGSRVLLDTQTRAQRVKDGGIAFGLKAERVQTLHSQTVGSR